MKTKKVIIFALIFGLLSAFSVFWYVQQLENQHSLPLVNVLTAKSEIPANTRVEPEMLEWQSIPEEYIHPSAVKDKSAITETVTRTELVPGEQLLMDKLITGENYEDVLSHLVEPGYRAVSIPINKVVAVSNLVSPGDKVDVIATLDLDLDLSKPEDEDKDEGKTESVTLTTYVLQNLKVLALGTHKDPAREVTEGDTSTLTLSVKPQEAPKLVLASERGSIRLLLRSPVDDSIAEVPPVEMKDLVEGKLVDKKTLIEKEGEALVEN